MMGGEANNVPAERESEKVPYQPIVQKTQKTVII